jgi:hypothetical protein
LSGVNALVALAAKKAAEFEVCDQISVALKAQKLRSILLRPCLCTVTATPAQVSNHQTRRLKMLLRALGGFSALVCASTYVVGFFFLMTELAPLKYGTAEVEAASVVAFIAQKPGFLIAWNTVIYIVNALALVLLIAVLRAALSPSAPVAAAVSTILGTIWATLVLGAGMIANVSVERVHALAADPESAIALWRVLHAVELGLGGGNEIAGGAWILSITVAAAPGRSLSFTTLVLGVVTGIAGLVTLLPRLSDAAGAVFGVGAIAWFFLVSVGLLSAARKARVPELT